jgi:hypothetical protein
LYARTKDEDYEAENSFYEELGDVFGLFYSYIPHEIVRRLHCYSHTGE